MQGVLKGTPRGPVSLEQNMGREGQQEIRLERQPGSRSLKASETRVRTLGSEGKQMEGLKHRGDKIRPALHSGNDL